ncbi:MAG: DUF1028 domain-containing protein, partial [Polyangiales bacterium]
MVVRFAAACVPLLLVCSQAHATYSLLIADARTGLLGSVGTSCVGASNVSRISGLAPGFGAIHAQAASNAQGRDRGVMMLKAGATAEEVIAAISAPSFDLLASSRQYGVVTLEGSSAGYTGSTNGAFAQDRQKTFGDYVTSYQGNILTSAKVLDQLEAALAEGACDLPETLMRALEAGAENGEGDSRCTRNGIPADSGFVKVVTREGEELISLEVTSQNMKGAVVALRERFDDWRATHPCARIEDAGAVVDASVIEDAATPVDAGREEDASAPPAARDATVPRDAAVARDASVARPDAGMRDAGAATADQEGGGCSLGSSRESGFAL